MKNQNSLLIAIILTAFVGCGKNHDTTTASPDKTAAVIAVVGTNELKDGNTSLRLAPDNTFALTYDTDVRYFPTDGEGSNRESDAHCLLAVSGFYGFTDPTGFVAPGKATLQMAVTGATVIAAKVLRADESSVAPKVVCQTFVTSVLFKKSFSQLVSDYGKNYVGLLQFNFDISDVTQHSNYLFNSSFHLETSSAYLHDSMRNYYIYDYLVGADQLADVTAIVSPSLDGDYTESTYTATEDQATKFTWNSKVGKVFLTNANCGYNYVLDINQIYFDNRGLWANLHPKENTSFEPSQGQAPTAPCMNLKQRLTSLMARPVQISYAVNVNTRPEEAKKSIALWIGETGHTPNSEILFNAAK